MLLLGFVLRIALNQYSLHKAYFLMFKTTMTIVQRKPAMYAFRSHEPALAGKNINKTFIRKLFCSYGNRDKRQGAFG